MKILLATLLFLSLGTYVLADDDPTELYTCSFVAHTPVGSLTGDCTTQSEPAAGYIARWKFTLIFDARGATAAAKIAPDTFNDMLRSQCLEDGSFTVIMPLWGDFLVKPNDTDYINSDIACTPFYQTAPTAVTLTQTSSSPLTLQFLYEEKPADFNAATGFPTVAWTARYLESFRRLQQTQNAAGSATAASRLGYARGTR